MDYQKYYECRKMIRDFRENDVLINGLTALIATLENTNELLKKISDELKNQGKK